MSQRSLRGLFGGRTSAASLALIASLFITIALPSPVFAWNKLAFDPGSESDLLTFINQLRTAPHPCTFGSTSMCTSPALTVVSTVHTEARNRSKDMYSRDYFSHSIPPDGHNAFDDLTAMGYCFKAAGEDIGWNNYPDDDPNYPDTTRVAFNGWKNSKDHYNVMVSSVYTVVGIGSYKGDGRWAGPKDSHPYWEENSTYPAHVFTAVFAKPCASPTPTPTPRPTATPTPRPTATPTPRPTATPTPTPRPTVTPTPGPKPTPRPTVAGSTPAPTAPPVPPAATPEATVQPTAEPSPAASAPVFLGPYTPQGEFGGNPHNWRGGGEPSGGNPAPSGGPSSEPIESTGPFLPEPGSDGLQVIEPAPDVDLLDAVVGGVVGTFFGH